MSEALLLEDPPFTIAAFDAFLDHQSDPTAWELVAGRIIGMTNPSQRHERIASNIGFALRDGADRYGCHIFLCGMRVQRSDNIKANDKPKPDVLVRCGRLQEQNYVTDPLVIVEVLSPSTMDVDRGDKLRFYKRLPTLAHIVLVYQDQMRAEHYRRVDTGWETEVLTGPDDHLGFDALACGLSMEDAYAGVPLGGGLVSRGLTT